MRLATVNSQFRCSITNFSINKLSLKSTPSNWFWVLHVLSMWVWPVFKSELMNLSNALHLAGKLDHRCIIAASGFHVAVRSQLLKHRPLNTPFLRSERLAFSRLIRRAIRRFCCLMRCCCDLRICFAISAASLRRPAGDIAAISPASLSSKGLNSFIPFAHQLTIDIQLSRSRHRLG